MPFSSDTFITVQYLYVVRLYCSSGDCCPNFLLLSLNLFLLHKNTETITSIFIFYAMAPFARHFPTLTSCLICICILDFRPTKARELTPFETIKLANPKLNIGREFLYSKDADKDGDPPHPILEYVNASSTNDPSESPDFIFDSVDYHRMVVFYSPSCPHCIHFAPKYKEFARYFQDLTNDRDQPLYAGINIKFFAVSCTSYKKICQRTKTKGYPTIKVFLARGIYGVVLQQNELHPLTMLKALGEGFVDDKWEDKKSVVEEDTTRQLAGSSPHFYFKERSQEEMYGDAYLAFHKSMQSGVFLGGKNPSIKQKQALLPFLKLLQKTLPPWRLNFLLIEFLDGFTKNVMDAEIWGTIAESYPPPQREFSPACKQHKMPYTCGIWTLFHLMTVGLVEFNNAVMNKNDNAALQSPKAAAQILRDYVHLFLPCEDCAAKFVQAFDACALDHCTRLIHPGSSTKTTANDKKEEWKELSLWLVQFHNDVNLRIQKERFEREGRPSTPSVTSEEEQSVMWPSVNDCPLCWINPIGAASRYNATMMQSYLRLVYW